MAFLYDNTLTQIRIDEVLVSKNYAKCKERLVMGLSINIDHPLKFYLSQDYGN